MNNKDFESLVQGFRIEQDQLILTKGNDYTVQNEDRLHNFKFVAAQLGISPLQALGVYWLKHVLAICTYFKYGKVESEEIHGRFLDESNYNLLGRALISELSGDKFEKVCQASGEDESKAMSKVRKQVARSGRKKYLPEPGTKRKESKVQGTGSAMRRRRY
jgi:hypothetical protein